MQVGRVGWVDTCCALFGDHRTKKSSGPSLPTPAAISRRRSLVSSASQPREGAGWGQRGTGSHASKQIGPFPFREGWRLLGHERVLGEVPL